MNQSIKKYAPLVLIVVGFIIFKIPQLSLPHYWDESWSYATAVQLMYEKGLTLLPGFIDVEATRGHPLFFYAAAASWMKIFGTSLISKHTFALFISTILLITIYEAGCKLYNIRVAILSTILFASQIFFFVQSSMLLPEVMVALFFFTSIYFFVCEKYIALAISLSLLLLTKESGLVLGAVFGIAFIVLLFRKDYPGNEKIKMFVALFFPGLIIVSFFIIQKLQYGWFFFPDHIKLIDLSLNDFSAKFQALLSVIFLEEKRKWLWIIICVLAVFYSIRKKEYKWLLFVFVIPVIFVFISAAFDFLKKPIVTISFILYAIFVCIKYRYFVSGNGQKSRFIILAVVFSIAYLIFCSVNFYTVRYLMPVLLISLILFSVCIDYLFKHLSLKLYFPFAIVVLALSIQSYIKNNSTGDTGLGSYNALKVQQGVINFLATHDAQNKQIGIGSFQQRINMQNAACGFISSQNESFQHVRWDIDSLTDYAVFDNIEPDSRNETIKNDTNFVLIYEIHEQNAWGMIFKRNKFD